MILRVRDRHVAGTFKKICRYVYLYAKKNFHFILAKKDSAFLAFSIHLYLVMHS